MLFYIANLLLSVYRHYTEESLKMRFLRMIARHIEDASVILRKSRAGVLSEASVPGLPRQELVPPECSTHLWSDGTMEVLTVQPQLHVNLSEWTSYLGTQDYADSSLRDGNCHILLEVSPPDDPQKFLENSLSIPPSKRVKVMDLASPLAWKSGTPFSIVAECTPDALSQLGVGLKEGRLLLDDMLELHCITTVCLHGHAISLLRTNSFSPEVPVPSSAPPCTSSPVLASAAVVEHQKSWDNILDSLHSVLEEEAEGGGQAMSGDESNESLASLPLPDGCGEDAESRGFVAGLTPQHEQILRIKEATMNGQESDTATEGSSVIGDTAAGEAPSEALELLAPEILTPAHRRQQNKSKPPNVLIYCGKKDSSRQYDAVKNVFGQCLNSQRYTVYHLRHDQVQCSPWQENTVLLIVASDKVYDGVDKVFLDYFMQGGTVLSFTSAYDAQFLDRIQISKNMGITALSFRHWKDVTTICGRYVYKSTDTALPDVNVTCLAKDKQTDRAIMAEANHELSGGVALLTQVNLDKDPAEMAISPDIFATLKKNNPARFEILTELLTQLGMDCDLGQVPPHTPAYLLTTQENLRSVFLATIAPRLKEGLLRTKDLSLHFCSQSDKAMATVTKETLPVCTDCTSVKNFNFESYRENLHTKVLGQVVFYAEVVHSTMNMFEGLMFSVPQSVGLIAVAARQTAGQGRGGNAWISPPGCAMFSLHVRVPVGSPLGQRAAFIQHITSLAVVEAVLSLAGYEDLELRIKWPNDIYFGSTMKLGGVLVKSSVMTDIIHANIGCGVNVTNTDPTICINDLVSQHNSSHGTALRPVTGEQLIAGTVTHIERLVALFQTEGRDKFVELYYRRWLHSNVQVHIQNEDIDAKIIGLDDFGYLAVQTSDGTTMSVHDDGNSFDMMKNLIVPKTR